LFQICNLQSQICNLFAVHGAFDLLADARIAVVLEGIERAQKLLGRQVLPGQTVDASGPNRAGGILSGGGKHGLQSIRAGPEVLIAK
jgi:hypothetical protein